jgi:hypothetical protein
MTTPNIAGQRQGVWNARLRAALPAHLDRLTWDADRIRAHQRDRLGALLRHAKAHSRFHAERLAGVDPARFELADLPSLPTMTKAEMMAGLDDLLTDPRCTMPIGGGPRACIGGRFALTEAVVATAVVLAGHELRSDAAPVPLTTAITLRPAGPVWCQVAARRPAARFR